MEVMKLTLRLGTSILSSSSVHIAGGGEMCLNDKWCEEL